MWAKIVEWIRNLFREEWELTIYFPGNTTLLPDNSRVFTHNPKTYQVKKIRKLTPKHMIFIEVGGIKHEVKTIEPVGYDLRKTK